MALAAGAIDEGGTTAVTVTVKDIETAGARISPAGTVTVSSVESTFEFTGACNLSASATPGESFCSVSVKGKHGLKTAAITAVFPESE